VGDWWKQENGFAPRPVDRRDRTSPWPGLMQPMAPPFPDQRNLNGPPSTWYWFSTEQPLVFGNPAVAPYSDPEWGPTTDVTARAIWQSPIFDLRPDLGNASNYRPQAKPIPRDSTVRLQIFRPDGVFLVNSANDFLVYSVESVAISNPARLLASNDRQEITHDFYDGSQASLLGWTPPGVQSPVRFWRVSVIFDWIDLAVNRFNLSIWASAH
jgi:hypothetical protein